MLSLHTHIEGCFFHISSVKGLKGEHNVEQIAGRHRNAPHFPKRQSPLTLFTGEAKSSSMHFCHERNHLGIDFFTGCAVRLEDATDRLQHSKDSIKRGFKTQRTSFPQKLETKSSSSVGVQKMMRLSLVSVGLGGIFLQTVSNQKGAPIIPTSFQSPQSTHINRTLNTDFQ